MPVAIGALKVSFFSSNVVDVSATADNHNHDLLSASHLSTMLGDFNVIDVLLACVGLYTLKRIYSTCAPSGRPPLPPGPKPKPVIGNLLDMPPAGQLEWLHWAKHKDLYGELRYLLTNDVLTIILRKTRSYQLPPNNGPTHNHHQ